jgi:hypothetical protein
MTGGLIQLVAYGAQDVHLTSNPSITMFKTMIRRHTNFSVEAIKHTFQGSTGFGRKVVCQIARNGDLLSRTYVRVQLSGGTAPGDAKWAWVKHLGHALIKSAELSIGGQRIDLQDATWLQIWYELTHETSQERGYDKLIGNTEELTTLATSHDATTLYIPLQFFFNRRTSLALPLIALQYHNVELEIEFEKVDQLIVTTGFQSASPAATMNLHMVDAYLLCDMIFLDTDERRKFATESHMILMEQVQYNGIESIRKNNTTDINFNHPVKEIIFGIHPTRYTNASGAFKYLWYHPYDLDALRLIATKRFVLATAKYVPLSTDLAFSEELYDAHELMPADGLPADLVSKFNEIKAVAITPTATVDNITILGELLSLQDITRPVSELFGNWSRPTFGHGAALHDVVVRMPFNFSSSLYGTGNPLESAVLQLNGINRFEEMDATYFNYVQPLQHHRNTPSDGLNIYSFALQPQELQPSGALNFSRVDTAVLNTKFTDTNRAIRDALLFVYGLSYNVLRIESGMGGLMYSN